MLPFLLLLPFFGAALLMLLPRERLSPLIPAQATVMVTLGCLALLGVATFLPPSLELQEITGERFHHFHADWMPSIGLTFSLWLDGPALFFCWMVLGIGLLIFVYAGFYMDPADSPWRFFGTMMLFMGSMLGVVMSRNALLMFVFWELTSLTSFILIGHWHHKESARKGAMRALVVTGLGGLCLMAGIAGYFWILSTASAPGYVFDPSTALNWDSLWANRELLLNHPASVACLMLVLLGAFTKSAQFPFHFWLPGAMEAPTPVSAFLHAATMVKAGIYLLGRLYPIYWSWELWLILVGSAGVITMLVGGFMAMTSRDLKQLLAHSTVSQLGLLTAYYGFGFDRAGGDKPLPMDLLLVLSHAMFKGALFMIVGVIDHGAHTREWTRLGGLRKYMPVTTVLTIVACASMAGFPLTFGFVAKELFLKTALSLHASSPLLAYGLPAVAIIASLFTVAYSLRMAVSPFFGKPRDPSIHEHDIYSIEERGDAEDDAHDGSDGAASHAHAAGVHEGGPGLLIPPGILVLACLVAGFWSPFLGDLLSPLVNAPFYGTESGFTVAFFHHADKLLWTAVFLFGVGVLVFLAGKRIMESYERAGSPAIFRHAYEAIFDRAIPSLAAWTARTSQTPSLRRSIAVFFAAAFGIVVAAMGYSGFGLPGAIAIPAGLWMATLPIALTLPCLWVAATHRVLLVRVLAMAPIGFFVAMFFVFFRAPDLALTQILVEVVILIVLLMVLFRLPQRFEPRQLRFDPTAGAIALVGALVMAALTYSAMGSPWRHAPTLEGQPSVRDYYLGNAKYPAMTSEEAAAIGYPGASNMRSGGGTNVVNVTLVDFRGIDTFGEIIVLGISAIGVLCLLTVNRRRRSDNWRGGALDDVGHVSDIVNPETHRQLEMPYRAWPSPSLLLSEIGRLAPGFVLIFAAVLFFAGHNAPGGGFIAGLMVSVGLAMVLIAVSWTRSRHLERFDFVRLIGVGLLVALLTVVVPELFGLPFLTSGHWHFHLPLLGGGEFATAAIFDLGVFLLVVGATMLVVQKLGKE